jgi:hypothetical protein
MRNTDERMNEILKRAGGIKEKHEAVKTAVAEGIGAAVALALFIAVCIILPGVQASTEALQNVRYGSLLLDASYSGYVVIGFLAFVLGILLTLLALQVRKIRQLGRGV